MAMLLICPNSWNSNHTTIWDADVSCLKLGFNVTFGMCSEDAKLMKEV
jgi:hypothetical protein